MRPDFEALAELLSKERPADVQDAAGVAGILATRREEASRMVAGWIAARTAPSVSPWAILNFEDADAYEQLALIISRPSSIDQGDLGHCGPAAILVILFTYFPKMMARFARDLIVGGTGHIGSLQLEATASMQAVTRQDLQSVAPPRPQQQEPILPSPLTWMMLAVVLYSMSENEDDMDGLGDGSLPGQWKKLLKDAGLATDFEEDNSFQFDLNNRLLVTKKDHTLKEILLSCDGTFLDQAGEIVPSLFGDHVIWLKNYSHVPPKVEITYYTWGSLLTKKYDSSTFKANATDILSFTMKLGAAD